MLMETAEVVPYPRDELGRVVEEPELAPALAPVKAFWRRTEFQPDGRRTGTVYCHDEVLRQVCAAEEARVPAARLLPRPAMPRACARRIHGFSAATVPGQPWWLGLSRGFAGARRRAPPCSPLHARPARGHARGLSGAGGRRARATR